MIAVENIKVYNIARAVYSARNPLQSWAKSDSDLEHDVLGKNDLDLARRLYSAGTEHRKFMRQIFVTIDITAPDYFFKEFSTYKVGTVENSTSTMHTIHKRPFTFDDFSYDHMSTDGIGKLGAIIRRLNNARDAYLESKGKEDWYTLISLLPMSYLYRRTVTMNYENVVTIIRQRTGHKLYEWADFIKILRELPYVTEIMGES